MGMAFGLGCESGEWGVEVAVAVGSGSGGGIGDRWGILGVEFNKIIFSVLTRTAPDVKVVDDDLRG